MAGWTCGLRHLQNSVPEYVLKSVKADAGERIKVLIRQFVQVLVSGGGGAAEFLAGGLFLLGGVSAFYRYRNSHLFVFPFPQLFSSIPGLRAMINSPTKAEGELYDARKRIPSRHMPRLCGNSFVPFFFHLINPSLIIFP